MIINTNVAAMNTFNALNKNTSAMNQALAELSSGKKINSAADDPSGLTISEQMQGQINGLNQANDNTQNGISLIQTAEGGLTETQSILQTMRELAVQASNGTNTTTDLQAIQDQINQYSGADRQHRQHHPVQHHEPARRLSRMSTGTSTVHERKLMSPSWVRQRPTRRQTLLCL